MTSSIYSQTICDEGAKDWEWTVSPVKEWCWENHTAPGRRMTLGHYLNCTQELTQNELKICV